MKYIRIMPQGVQVPEVTYKKGNKEIVIQGAVHIGSRKFYEKVVDRIKGYNGESHLEGIISTNDKHNSKKDLLNSVYITMAAFSNLSYQKEFINKSMADEKKIFNYDMNDEGITDNVFDKKFIKALKEINTKKTTTNTVLNIGASPLFNFLMLTAGNGRLEPELEEVILHKRNNYAIRKALETKNNVFLFWGAKHLEGMNEILLANGYSIIRTKWLTAIPMLRLKNNHEQRKGVISNNLIKIQELASSLE